MPLHQPGKAYPNLHLERSVDLAFGCAEDMQMSKHCLVARGPQLKIWTCGALLLR